VRSEKNRVGRAERPLTALRAVSPPLRGGLPVYFYPLFYSILQSITFSLFLLDVRIIILYGGNFFMIFRFQLKSKKIEMIFQLIGRQQRQANPDTYNQYGNYQAVQ
jgi:hypothetical protein